MTPPPDLEHSVIVVSPHFDDGVLSLGGLLYRLGRRATLVTVFGGAPVGAVDASDWDRRCGFDDPQSAVRTRQREDATACRLLGIGRLALSHPDNPYDPPDAELDHLTDFLTSHAARESTLLVCAGIGNEDHARVRDAVVAVRTAADGPSIWLYADLPYAASYRDWGTPGFTAGIREREKLLFDPLEARFRLSPEHWTELDAAQWQAKRDAVLAYASQLAPLGRTHGAFLSLPGPLGQELIWRLEPR
ncbi:PIG-L deacetylase family protein [Streptomyces californicus]|uniref:PIG-L deacetylase family protein n=1 Tax=Streptomyces TaxID=1883 RepID=UPI0004C28B83|nr:MULTISPECIES: PIG-L family deacetylase [unclassified Streptomyces]MBK0377240.1 PIG-L family deacetylase [Streptomyces sp. RB110-1]MBK0386388.1 PIG-L family deacetylase [Streptomyces sp. RB110-2]